jgi:hypothetical protein
LRDILNWPHSADALASNSTRSAAPADLAKIAHALIDEEEEKKKKTGAQARRTLAQRERGIDVGLDSLLLMK